MNTIVTSRSAIIAAARILASEKGLSNLNMRDVAKSCGISIGSVYNYFPSKADLIIAIIEDIWVTIFHQNNTNRPYNCFPDEVSWFFSCVKRGSSDYPEFFTVHTLALTTVDKNKGRMVMYDYLGHIKKGFILTLAQDKNVKNGVFDQNFTEQQLIDFVIHHIFALLAQGATDCDTLLAVIKKLLY